MTAIYFIIKSNFTKGDNFSRNGTSPMLPTFLPPLPLLTLEERDSLRLSVISSTMIIGLLSLFGNSSILAIMYLNHKMRTSANFYIVNMATSDLLYDIIVIPDILEKTFTWSGDMWTTGVVAEILCRLIPFVRDVSFTVSILSMVAIALDRFYAIVYPLKMKPFYLKTKIVMPLIWIVAMSSFAMYWHFYCLVPPNFCIPLWSSKNLSLYIYCLIVTLYFLFPLLVMAVLYSIIIYQIKRQIIPGHNTSAMESARRNRNKNVTKIGVLIVVWFFISWAPYHTLHLLRIFCKGRLPGNTSSFLTHVIANAFELLSLTNIASNPIVCYACSTNFRECLMQLLCCSICERRRQRSRAALNSYPNSRKERQVKSMENKQRNVRMHGLSNCVFEEERPGKSSSIERSL